MPGKLALALLVLLALPGQPVSADGLYGEGFNPMTPPMKDRITERARLRLSLNLRPDQLQRMTGHFGRPRDTLSFVQGVFQRCAVWLNNQELKVCFVDKNDRTWRKTFVEASMKWVDHRPQLLNFGDPPDYRNCDGDKHEDIRVAFNTTAPIGKPGHWGCVGRESTRHGTECGGSPESLNVNPVLAKHDREIIRIAAIHEMGHALGLMHEHQHPHKRCWDEEIHKDRACATYRGLIDCDHLAEVFDNLDDSAHGTTPYDNKSIMHYAIPREIFMNPDTASCVAPENKVPSPDDLALVRKLYPPGGSLAGSSGCDNEIAAVSQMLGLDLNQKSALAEELTLRVAAGLKSKTPLNIKLDGGLGVQPPTASFGGQETDCTPASLRGKASCSLSAHGGALKITID